MPTKIDSMDLLPKHRKLFASRMKYKRNFLGLSQSRLSQLTGMATSHISALETGQVNPSLDVMIRISRALDESLAYFVIE
ncbi:helix-turn-helix domain-containing protein [Novosphingobium acidiphilum]|uniref:helix-turn-helix domain-containing protein n=1 Tax=Novosphingobium acidiphilum TaxID=505248 RepID=UPI000A02582F